MHGALFALVMVVGPSSEFRAVAIDHISGYQNEATCLEAGKLWAAVMRTSGRWATFACIPAPESGQR